MSSPKPEEKVREIIDGLLEAAGWTIQNYNEFNLGVSLGVAIREFPI
jgi:type I restriction enzyme R subunit